MKKLSIKFFVAFLILEFGAMVFAQMQVIHQSTRSGSGLLFADPEEEDDKDPPQDPILHSPIPQDAIILSDGTIIIIPQ